MFEISGRLEDLLNYVYPHDGPLPPQTLQVTSDLLWSASFDGQLECRDSFRQTSNDLALTAFHKINSPCKSGKGYMGLSVPLEGSRVGSVYAIIQPLPVLLAALSIPEASVHAPKNLLGRDIIKIRGLYPSLHRPP
jgi:hypothetical protein